MRAIIRLKKLTPRNCSALVVSINNDELYQIMTFNIADGLYDDLLINFKSDILVEIEQGLLTKVYQQVGHNDVVLGVNHKFNIIQYIVSKDIYKNEAYSIYSTIIGCNERTSRRHFADAVKLRVIVEKNHYEFAPLNVYKVSPLSIPSDTFGSGQSGQSGQEDE